MGMDLFDLRQRFLCGTPLKDQRISSIETIVATCVVVNEIVCKRNESFLQGSWRIPVDGIAGEFGNRQDIIITNFP